MLDLALDRLARPSSRTDPSDVFYDHGDARVLAFLERASEDLRGILAQAQRYARLSRPPRSSPQQPAACPRKNA